MLTKPDAARGERTHRWPAALPGGSGRPLHGRVCASSPSNYDEAEIHVLDLATPQGAQGLRGRKHGALRAGGPPRVPARQHAVLVAPFDPRRVAVTGEAVPALEKVGGDTSGGAAYCGRRADGTLAYARGVCAPAGRTLVLVDRKGEADGRAARRRVSFEAPRFSPDGKRLAFSVGSGDGAGRRRLDVRHRGERPDAPDVRQHGPLAGLVARREADRVRLGPRRRPEGIWVKRGRRQRHGKK